MANYVFSSCLVVMLVMCSVSSVRPHLSPDFYDELCPSALPTIKLIVEQAVAEEARMGASLLRLHFHDCFVNGCDGSVLLDDTSTFTGEKTAKPNMNSLRGYEVIDKIKDAVNSACGGNVVSCADILAVAARDSVAALGGPCYDVQLGRRDSVSASITAANNQLPAQTFNLPALLSNFKSHGLSMQDLVILSGAHTLGFARCTSFRARLYNETSTLSPAFASTLETQCPRVGGDNNLSGLDGTPITFDTVYFNWLVNKMGLLHSDQQLYKGDGSGTDSIVEYYFNNPNAFWNDFGESMIKMGSMKPLTGSVGQIRMNCRKVNY